MNDYSKWLPQQINGVAAKKFWEDLKEEKFMYQQCDDCNSPIFYPRVVCPNCMSENLNWHQASNDGKIYSFTVVYKSTNPAFKENVPYIVGLIDLAEGIRVMGNIVGIDDPEALQIGQPVKIEFNKVTDEFTFPVFRVNEGEIR
ncbi:Zn-ribbon domain-containing OB-fold protein [Peribacillus sp. NPDC060186]